MLKSTLNDPQTLLIWKCQACIWMQYQKNMAEAHMP